MFKLPVRLFASTGVTISAGIFLSLVFVMYLSKKKFKTFDSMIYLIMFLLSFIVIASELLYIFAMYCELDSHIKFLPLIPLCYMYLFFCICWFASLILYIYSKIKANSNLPYKKGEKATMIILLSILSIVLFTSSLFLKIDYPIGNSGLYVFGGSAVYALYTMSILALIIVAIVLIVKGRNYPGHQKYPLYFCILFLITVNVVQQILDYDWNTLSFLMALVITTLYFTIESQDFRLINELERKSKEAEMADKAKTQFLSNMSHEIRTPLNTIISFGNSLLSEEQITEEMIENEGNIIHDSSEELHEIIDNILDISSIESGKIKLDNTDYDMQQLIYDIDNSVKSKIKSDKVEFKVDVNSDVLQKYNGDHQKISKMLIDISDSLLKHMEFGKVTLKVSGRDINNNQKELTFEVLSTASELDKEKFDSMFNNFKVIDADESVNIYNMSLELIVAKEYLDLLNGSYKIEDAQGGTLYRFIITQLKEAAEQSNNDETNNKVEQQTENEEQKVDNVVEIQTDNNIEIPSEEVVSQEENKPDEQINNNEEEQVTEQTIE